MKIKFQLTDENIFEEIRVRLHGSAAACVHTKTLQTLCSLLSVSFDCQIVLSIFFFYYVGPTLSSTFLSVQKIGVAYKHRRTKDF